MKKILAGLALAVSLLGFTVSPTSASGKADGMHAPKGNPLTAKTGIQRRTGTTYYYAEMHQNPSSPQTVTSLAGVADIEAPGQVASGEHSLAEFALASSDGKQIVEIGWIVDPTQFGDSHAHLFVYHWVNGASTCYNGCGWVDASGNPVNAGADINGDIGGTAKQFNIQYDSGTNAWWGYYKGLGIGYFPATIWSGASPPVTFTSAGKQQVFGEVYGPSSPCDDMGDGVISSGTGPARLGSVTYSTGGAGVVDLKPLVTNASWYNVTNLGTGMIRSFAYGGPGAC